MKFKRLLTFALAATLSFSALTGCVPGGRDWYGFRDAGGILYGGRKNRFRRV